jgi:hypothetical protein
MSLAALTARLFDNRNAIVALSTARDALSHCGARGISATSAWYDAWIDAFGKTVSPCVIAVTDETGALRGVPPLAALSRQLGGLRVRVLEMGGESVVCGDPLGLVAAATDDQVWAVALPLLQTLGRDADVIHLRSLTATTAPGGALGSLTPSKWHAVPTTGAVAPRISLDELERLHQNLWTSRNVTGAFSDPLFGAFVRRFARSAHARGWLRLHQLVIDGETVAALLAYHWEGVGSYYTSGWNPACAKWHVGEVLLAHVIRTAADEGLASFDCGRGADAYKSRFATEPVPLLAAMWSTSSRGHVAVGANRLALRATREWNRGRTRVSRLLATRRRPTGVSFE